MADTISSCGNCQSTGGVVYLIVNTVNGKMYVGQTTRSVEERFKEHAKLDYLIGRAIRHDGQKNFRYGVIKTCASKAELDYWEKFFIAALKTKAPLGYNCTDGGEGIIGCAEITREKMRKANRGENNPNYGKASVRRCRSPYKNLIAELEARKLNYTAFAKLLGLSIVAISMRLSGQRKFTEADTVKIIEFSGKPIDWLLARDDGKTTLSTRKNSPFKNLLRELEARGLLFADLAKILGVSKSHITSRMSGKKKFTERDAAKLVEFFDKPIEYLLTRDDGEFALAKRKSSPYKNLVAELKARGFLYADLAKILGLSKYTINSKMHGEVRFTARDKAKLVEFFDKPIEYLLARDDA